MEPAYLIDLFDLICIGQFLFIFFNHFQPSGLKTYGAGKEKLATLKWGLTIDDLEGSFMKDMDS